MPPLFKLAYLPTNHRYCFALGSNPIRLYNTLGEPLPALFPTREAAIALAGKCGLKIDALGVVTCN